MKMRLWRAAKIRCCNVPSLIISVGKACQRLDIAQHRLNDLILQGKLEVLQRKSSNKDISVDATSLVDMRAWLNDLVSIDVLAHCLDININDTQDLIYHGCLNPRSGPALDRQPVWKFQYHAGHDLLKNIRERIVRSIFITSDQLISGGIAIREMKTYGLSVGQFVRAIIDGRIIP